MKSRRIRKLRPMFAKRSYYSPSKFNKFIIICLPILALVILLAKNFKGYKALVRERYEEKKELNEMSILISEGYYKEAIRLIDRAGKKSNKKFIILKLQALMGKKDYAKALKLLSKHRDLAKEEGLIDNFYIQMLENGKEGQAFKLINEYKECLSQDSYKEKMKEVLGIYRKLPIEGEFVFGWYKKRAILKDKSGYYLVDEEGNRVSPNSYEILEMGQKSLYGKRNKFWVELDFNGNLKRLVDKPETAMPHLEDSYILRPAERRNMKTISYDGEDLGDEVFDQVSNISKKGRAFVKQDKKTYKLTWPALED